MTDVVSVLTGGSNSFQTTAEHINYPATDFISSGVVGAITNTTGVAPMTGALSVNAQGSPDMTVAVGAGACYALVTPTGQASQRLRAKIAAQNATIAANATGGTRFDWIYVTFNATNANTPAVGGDNVASITVSRSTSSGSDTGTPPTYGYNIAIVTVANGASSISNGNIADSRSQAGASAVASSVALTVGSNPYKFSVYRNGAYTTGSPAKVQFDSEEFDTNNNFDSTTNYRYTAPVNGFYSFNACVGALSGGGGGVYNIAIYKNGSVWKFGPQAKFSSAETDLAAMSAIIQLTAGDYVEVYQYGGGAAGVPGQTETYFQGFLISKT